MIKVLDLFSGTQSVKKALSGIADIDYIGVDIYSPEGENLIFDMTQDNVVEELIKVLPRGWKPDFIWSSPVCNKFSTATTVPGGNTYFIVKNDSISIRKDYSVVKHNGLNKHPERWEKYYNNAKLALKMHENNKKVIDYFKNIPFALENPRTSLVKYIYKKYVKNYTNYCKYGFTYKKSTTIYSNNNIELKICDHKGKHGSNITNNVGKYADRSRVPEALIRDIFVQLMVDRIKKGEIW